MADELNLAEHATLANRVGRIESLETEVTRKAAGLANKQDMKFRDRGSAFEMQRQSVRLIHDEQQYVARRRAGVDR